MSIFETATAACPACGTESEFETVLSVNADRRPDLRGEILAGTFQAVPCPKCGHQVRLPPEFTYLELRRKHWIAVYPSEAVERWQELERDAAETYDGAFGASAPDAARELAEGMVPRLAFGWPALQEKLVCAELGLEDESLELLKAAMLHDVRGLTLTGAAELRLSGGDAATLGFDWLLPDSGEVLNSLAVPRRAYDDIVDDPGPWAALRARIAGPAFVDMKRAVAGAAAA